MTRQIVRLTIAVAAILLIAGMVDILLAQGGPFGGPKGTPKGAPPDGFFAWIIAKQNEFNLAMREFLRQAKRDGTAVWGLLGVSFLYGIFHAAGPGHGKVVISSYVVANDETWKRGVVLSFASALLQAVVAVVFVGFAAILLNATQKMMCDAERVIEIVSYALIALIGVRLFWVKGRAFVSTLRGLYRPVSEVGAAVTPADHPSRHVHAHHDHSHDGHHQHGHEHHDHGGHDHHAHAHHDHKHDGHGHHDHDHGHEGASAWSHAHAPEPAQLAGAGGWRRGLSAVVAVGLRPCSGAIIVLIFALSQGLFWAGVAATFIMGVGTAITVAVIATIAVGAREWAGRFAGTRSGYGMLAMRGIEVAAASLIIAFGVLLLAGYYFSERLPLC